ncbi:MAG: hypothetical protein MUE46_15440 [Xanthomonadales bacterium]|jgi:hypothetical protein|nr:hypothetical protein [Xanthomonadales bacterium]
MNDLFKAECRRFLGAALIYALLHLGVLMFLTRMVDLAQQPLEVYFVFGAVYALSGLLLGLGQIGSYRRPNPWLNLLHRPLAPWRIALALLGAGALLLLIAVLLPLLATAAWQALLTPRVLDLRHLLLTVAGVDYALIGYLSGAAAMLLPRRATAVPMVFLALLPAAYATGAGALALHGLVLAWLLALVLTAFQPDLDRLPQGGRALLVLAPACVLMWLGLLAAGMAAELLWIAQGSHPNNLPQVLPGSAKEADQAEGAELLALGLTDSKAPEAALWREQAAISDIQTLGLSFPEGAVAGELTNRAPMEFDDEARRLRWVYSHDLKRFVGYRVGESGRDGVLGVDGDTPFATPPLPGPAGLLIGRDTVHQYDFERARVLPRIALAPGELIAGLALDGDRLALLSDRALYLYDARPLGLGEGMLQTRQRLPLPSAVGNLTRVDVLELLDGHLVSFTFTRHRHNGHGPSFQQLLRVHTDGRVDEIAHRPLATGYGPIYTWQRWWMSPAISTCLSALRPLYAPPQPAHQLAPPPRPALASALGLGGMLLSLGLGALYLRRTALTTHARLGWATACATLGLPALMTLCWLVPPRESPLPQAAMAAAA